jgi:hypothetical protein
MELVALSKASTLAVCRCFPVLTDWFCDPLGVKISSDNLMEWINKDNLKEFVCGIFTNPVSIQGSQNPTVVSSLFFSNKLKALIKL